MEGGRSKEPTRIANLRKRLHRIEQTKQRMKESGRPPDRRQLSALESEEEVRSEIAKWEQYGVVKPPQNPSQPRVREQALDASSHGEMGQFQDVGNGPPNPAWPPGIPYVLEPPNPNAIVDRCDKHARDSVCEFKRFNRV